MTKSNTDSVWTMNFTKLEKRKIINPCIHIKLLAYHGLSFSVKLHQETWISALSSIMETWRFKWQLIYHNLVTRSFFFFFCLFYFILLFLNSSTFKLLDINWRTAPSRAMKILSWNCQGLRNQSAIDVLSHLVREKAPKIFFFSWKQSSQ